MNDEELYMVLFTALINRCPRDTHNMVDNITLLEMEDAWKIRISGPTLKYDYAEAVNLALAAMAQGRPLSVKEQNNLHWVDLTIDQVCSVFGEVKYEFS